MNASLFFHFLRPWGLACGLFYVSTPVVAIAVPSDAVPAAPQWPGQAWPYDASPWFQQGGFGAGDDIEPEPLVSDEPPLGDDSLFMHWGDERKPVPLTIFARSSEGPSLDLAAIGLGGLQSGLVGYGMDAPGPLVRAGSHIDRNARASDAIGPIDDDTALLSRLTAFGRDVLIYPVSILAGLGLLLFPYLKSKYWRKSKRRSLPLRPRRKRRSKDRRQETDPNSPPWAKSAWPTRPRSGWRSARRRGGE